MSYSLNTTISQKTSTRKAFGKLMPYLKQEKKYLWAAFAGLAINSGINLTGPLLIGYAIDKYVSTRQYHGVLVISGVLLGMYIVGLLASYLQTRFMGGVGQRMLFNLRNAVFNKLQELPVGFFNQNKAGDLISRINNDTDKLNQFFSQSLMQFVGNIFTMVGAGIFLLVINPKLGVASLVPGLVLLLFTRFTSQWVKRKNAANMASTGNLSAEIQESLDNFKVIIAFDRRDYFRKRFDEANRKNYSTAVNAGLVNNIFMPIFSLCANVAQLTVLVYGIYLISTGQFTVGLLISYLAYVTNFYNPVRYLATLWTNFQTAMAGWDRISAILNMQSNLVTTGHLSVDANGSLVEFDEVYFSYDGGKEVLKDVSFQLERGKTYAFVGPTGGGKTTAASLIARLYDPTAGKVSFGGRDIRSYTAEERAGKIGFILQDPFLFSGTIRENIVYGNKAYENFTNDQLVQVIREARLERLLERFDQGLDTPVLAAGDSISLGQKQLIAFMRAVLRHPELLILDEATANIDTVTEQLLEDILQHLPATTTLVIIAHRLNTIENADEIFFVNAGSIVRAGSFDHAMKMLLHEERKS